MQTLSRVQSQIRSRRLRMNEENQALHRQLLLKHERELESLRMGEEWDDSLQSKEQIEASLVNKQEAAIRRERALAYAFSHQWKSSSRSANPMFMDPNNPQWGWSWLERWMAARSWEIQSKTDKENNTDRASLKATNQNTGEGEITRAYARRETKLDRPSPPTPKPNSIRPGTRKSPSTPNSRAPKIKLDSPRNGLSQLEDDVKSIVSAQSERIRRQSIGGSPSIRDDESLASSPSLPSYMVPTESARAKSRLQSPSIEKIIKTPEKGSAGSIKKRLSFTAGDKHNSALPLITRRHSGPPKVDIAAMKGIEVRSELDATNGANQ
ncbi:protein IQ-DOMAIN 1-like [Ananas comosus]|nr:protein IQ-DOMAIN 1-like [Ananas comosus]